MAATKEVGSIPGEGRYAACFQVRASWRKENFRWTGRRSGTTPCLSSTPESKFRIIEQRCPCLQTDAEATSRVWKGSAQVPLDDDGEIDLHGSPGARRRRVPPLRDRPKCGHDELLVGPL